MADEKSELERGLQSLSRVLSGVTGRLLGPKAIGREVLPPEVAISPEADAAISKAGADLGRLVNAAAEGLKAHPMQPGEALKTAQAHQNDTITPEEGWSPLAAGLMNLGGGLAKVAEGVLDVVAPRKPKGAETPEAEAAEAPDEGTTDAVEPDAPEDDHAA